MLTREEVQKLAELALIEVAPEELDALTHEIDGVLGYVSEVTTLVATAPERVKPELYNIMRDDVVTNEPGSYTEALLREAPDREGAYLRVKKIL